MTEIKQINDLFIIDESNNTFVVDSANARVGIGTTTPGYPLSVTGAGNFTGNLTVSSIFKVDTAASQITLGTTTAVAGNVLTVVGNTDIAGTTNTTTLQLNGTTVTATATELNQLSGVTLGTAASNNTGDFATAAQGALANTALQTVAVDGVTITGDGTVGNPLVASGGGGGGISIGDAVGSGTAGSILFVDASTNLAQDNTQLFWDDTNNRLGLGTTSPSHTLHVRNQTVAASAPIARFESDEGNILFNRYAGIMLQNNEPSGAQPIEANRWQIQQRDGDNVDPPDGPFDISYGDGSAGFVSASNTIFRITSGGNVGIGLGSTDPSETLHVKGNALFEDPSSTGTTDYLLEVRSASSATPDNARLLVSADTDSKLPMIHLRDIEANGGTFNGNYSAYFALDRASAVVTGSAQNDLLIANGNYNKDIHLCTNNAGNGSQAQARLTIVGTDGDVGIGTTSPAQKLHVVGTIRQTNSTNAVLVSNANGDIGSASNLQDIAYSDGLYVDGSGMYPLVPPAPTAWGGAPPATLNEAIDRLAAAVYNISGPIP
jgi:hypothetical protein